MTARKMWSGVLQGRCCAHPPDTLGGVRRAWSTRESGRRRSSGSRRRCHRHRNRQARVGFTRQAHGRSGGCAEERRAWPEHCAGRRIDGRQRGRRSPRWRQRVRRARRRSCGPPCRRRHCECARGMPVMDQEAIDRRLVEAGRHSKQGAAGRKCDGRRVDGRAARRSGGARHAAVAPSRGWRASRCCRCRWCRSSAEARTRDAGSIFRISSSSRSAHRRSTRRWSIAVRIYEAAGRIMAERGGLRGVADEGGWWPEFSSNSDALDALLLAIERADLRPGIDAAIADRRRCVATATGPRYRFAAENRELTSEELDRRPSAVVPPLSHRLCRGSAGPG